ncbi:MAG: hypothetical protein V4529_09970 [Gemmatimonadota bacterium]
MKRVFGTVPAAETLLTEPFVPAIHRPPASRGFSHALGPWTTTGFDTVTRQA